MAETSPWVPQEDGTTLPSAELVQAVRENPERFPNAVEDFTALSGLPREKVEAILANTWRPGGVSYETGTHMRPWTAFAKGAGEAAGFAADHLLGEGSGDGIREATEFDPAFDTEKGTAENLVAIGGQAAPAVAGGIAAGGVVAGGVVGAGISTLTFSDEDNVANLANDYLDGAVPDALVIQDGDDADTRAVKNMAANLIVDFAAAGFGHGIAKVYRVLRGAPEGAQAQLQQIAAEAGVTPKTDETATRAAQAQLETAAARAVDELPAPVESAKVIKQAAKDRVIADAAAKELGRPIAGSDVPKDIPQDVVQAFHADVFGPVSRLINRSKEVNVGRRQGLKGFSEEGSEVYVKHSEEVLKAIQEKQTDEVVRLIREGVKSANPNIDFVYRTSVMKAALERMDANFEAVILEIRKDPSLTTKKAWKELAAEYHADKLKVAELYREAGSSASYAFLTRKGVKFADDEIKALQEVEDELYKVLRRDGFNLRSSKTEFVVSKVLTLEDMGFDTLPLMDDLYRMFDEFDAARQGALDNAGRNSLGRMSKATREQLEGSWVRMLQDLHSSALLGQPSTSFLEVSSNFLNNLSLPITQHVLTKGNLVRAAREYAGYTAAWGRGWETFKKAYKAGKSVLDDFDVLDGAHASKIDYTKMADERQFIRYAMVRLWKFAADVSIAASEAHKAWRGMGIAYADGLELALKQGAKRPEAKKMALEYANGMFDETGAFRDAALKLDVGFTSWQNVMDTRYATGRLAQSVDNFRNHRNPVVAMLSRASVPFWRTLINIGSNSMQMTIPPVVSDALRLVGKRYKLPLKALDDFTGSNGEAARHRALGRSRLGAMMMGSAWGLMEAGVIDITGPAGYQGWDEKIAQSQEYPASSLIINGKAYDLTRFLPFSASLLLLGVMKDMQRENALQMVDGNWVTPGDSAFDLAATYGTALGMVNFAMMSDAAAFQGVGNLWEAISKAISEGDPRAFVRFAEGFGKQFIPGLPRVIGKNQGAWNGDWSQDQAEGFVNEALASAGYHTGYTRLDFLGKPVVDKWRGVDPFNTKGVKTDDAVRMEYVRLNKYGGLAVQLDKPNAIFDAADWKNLGVQPSAAQWLFGDEAPSLTQMKTTDGDNAWDRYRALVFEGRADKDISKGTGQVGDRIDIGDVTIKKGENWEAVIRRTVASRAYQNLTPDAQVKVWDTIFGVFKKNAKDDLKVSLRVDPTIFQGSRYGAPFDTPEVFSDVQKGAKALAVDVQTTRGTPEALLDDIFAPRK